LIILLYINSQFCKTNISHKQKKDGSKRMPKLAYEYAPARSASLLRIDKLLKKL